MKFLHLSDLHFGKSLYGVSLIDNKDQAYWKDRFLEKVEELQPDAIVIAGDIYDRSAPSGEAVVLLDSLLTRLEQLQIPVMMISGNHDSGQRLAFAGDILAKQNVYIAGSVDKELCHVTLQEKDGSGEVTFWLMPYLFPAIVAQKLEDDSIGDYEMAVRRLLEQQEIDFSKRNVLVAHQNITADGREAERGGSESMVGGVGQIDYRVFDGFDYVALGHIHSSYHVGRREVRYAGSPLCYHFNETRQPQKGPLLVELGKKNTQVRVKPQIIEPLHPMREIKGTFEGIRETVEGGRERGEYLRIVVTDRRITPEISDFLRELFRKRDSVVMELVSEYREFGNSDGVSGSSGRVEKSIEEFFAELYRERKDGVAPTEKDAELFRFVAELVQKADSADTGETALEKDADELLAYILRQEGGK
ncbi:MAG: exonuclease SbcCD subunit D [Lachnospiraceae bacterium]|nr:exonuclease SbcCD subunit D [Lachnospiraceae bacterium]